MKGHWKGVTFTLAIAVFGTTLSIQQLYNLEPRVLVVTGFLCALLIIPALVAAPKQPQPIVLGDEEIQIFVSGAIQNATGDSGMYLRGFREALPTELGLGEGGWVVPRHILIAADHRSAYIGVTTKLYDEPTEARIIFVYLSPKGRLFAFEFGDGTGYRLLNGSEDEALPLMMYRHLPALHIATA